MKYSWLVIVITLTAGFAAHSETPDERFARAAIAYDLQQYREAIDIYEDLLNEGLRAPELYYNLANTYYRYGDYGQAILHYLNASYLAPRNRDIHHNLRYVMLDADAVEAPVAWPARALRMVSLAEWVMLATLFWWLTAILAACICWKRRRRGWGVALTVSAALLLISLVGVYQWKQLRARPMVVVTKPGQEALFAPLADSTAYFALPVGSMARIDTTIDGWYRIRVGERDGWIRQSAATPVAP